MVGNPNLLIFIIPPIKVKNYWIRSFPEQNTQVSMIQISFQIKDEHNSGFLLECLSTIPGFMGKHVHSSQYADRRSNSIRSEYIWWKKDGIISILSLKPNELYIGLFTLTHSIQNLHLLQVKVNRMWKFSCKYVILKLKCSKNTYVFHFYSITCVHLFLSNYSGCLSYPIIYCCICISR